MDLDPKCTACIAWGNNGKCEGQFCSFESSACPLCQKYIADDALTDVANEEYKK